MKKVILISVAFMLFGIIGKATEPEWKMVSVPGLPDNAIIASMWTSLENRVFLAVTQYAWTDSSKIMIYYYNGASWNIQFQLSGNKRYLIRRQELFGTKENDVFLNVRNYSANVSEVYHYDGNTWQQQTMPAQLGSDELSNFAGETNNVYAGAGSKIYKYDGTSWQFIAAIARSASNLIYINANEIYAIECWGHTLWNGTNWTWYGSFDFCDVTSGWGMRDAYNNLYMFAAGSNNFGNGIRAWRFIESSTGSKTGSWGTKYDCNYLCDPSGTGYAWAGSGSDIWGSGPNDIYVVGSFGHPYNPNYATRIYHSDGTYPFTRMTIFDSLPMPTNEKNYTYESITGSGPNDVWIAVGNKLAHLSKPRTTVSIDNATKNWLETFDIPVVTTELKPDSNYISYQFDLAYDATKLQYLDKSLTGTIAENGTVIVNSSTPGQLSVSYMASTALIGAGNILKLQFKALEVGNAPVTISNFIYNNDSVNSSNGAITVVDTTPPRASITYSDADGSVRYGEILTITATFSEPMADSPVPQIVLSGTNTISASNMTKLSSTVYTYNHTVTKGNGTVNVTLQTGTDTHGNVVTATPTSGGSFNVIPLRYGDIDDNTYIRAFDAALALQYSVGLDPLPTIDPLPWKTWRAATANVDGTGDITANDASLILQYSTKLISQFPAENMQKSALANHADVSITMVNNKLVFQAKGSLFGLNLTADNGNKVLGTPNVLDKNMITAINISGTNYAIGLATAYAPTENTAFMEIPIAGSGASITFDMIVNTEAKTVIVDIATGIVEFSDAGITIYPNPAKDNLIISGIAKPTLANIYTLNGQLLQTSTLNNATSEISLNNLPDGVYIIKLKADKEIAVKRFVKQ